MVNAYPILSPSSSLFAMIHFDFFFFLLSETATTSCTPRKTRSGRSSSSLAAIATTRFLDLRFIAVLFADICAVVSRSLASLPRVSFPLYFRLFLHQHHSMVAIATLLRIYVFNFCPSLIVLVQAIGVFLCRKGRVRIEGGRYDLGLNIMAHEKVIGAKPKD
ncbi:hypothetical protein B296_00023393 [Ensete ventricosum]|uniref:Uncharacterized protein n=1 Tax=Ensete ventricosum TaxID=4639 RepID=A0A426ZYR9_ENSVE|nr:hypothetical protein B296_00023393 [Ensete ventricosum]